MTGEFKALTQQHDREMARTLQNAKLMALLDERAKQTRTIPLSDVKHQLGLEG